MSNRRERKDNIPHVLGSDNVFADLQVPEPNEAMLKARLAAAICEAIKGRKLKQTQAAELVGTDQAKISALMHGRLDGFSIERLVKFATLLGYDLEIKLTQTRDFKKGTPSITLESA